MRPGASKSNDRDPDRARLNSMITLMIIGPRQRSYSRGPEHCVATPAHAGKTITQLPQFSTLGGHADLPPTGFPAGRLSFTIALARLAFGRLARVGLFPACFLCACHGLGASVLAMAGNGVALDGHYTYRNLHLSYLPNVESSVQGDFHIELQGQAWAINFKNISAATNRSALDAAIDASCDGGNVYVVHRRNPLAVPSGVVMKEAEVYPGVLPPPWERDAYNLWLAFVSYLVWTNVSGRAMPPNIPDLSLFYDPDSGCRYSWVADLPNAGLKKLVLTSDPRILTRDIHHNGRRFFETLTGPYAGGYKMAEGRWLASTNLSSVCFPLSYEFSYFVPKAAPTSNTDVDLYHVFRCDVTNFYAAEIQPLPAGLQNPGFAMVTDHRFFTQGVASFTYDVTGQWSAALEQRVKGLAGVAREQSLEEQSLEQHGFTGKDRHAVAKFVFTVLLAVIVIAPLVWLLRGVFLKTKPETSTMN